MWGMQVAYYRSYQAVFNLAARLMPWRKAEVVSGAGALAKMPALLQQDGAKKALLVTDPGLWKMGLGPKAQKAILAAGLGCAVYSGVEPNPSLDTVRAVAALYKKEGCDSLVALGGGSAMDAAKAAGAFVAAAPKPLEKLGGLLHVRRKLMPFAAVPTTAGTGSETTIAAIVTDTKTHHKYSILDFVLVPKYAVLDPTLTMGLPPHITAATGMDALTHAIEAYLCWTYNTKESLRFAEQAAAAIIKYLPRAYKNGQDAEARQQMQVAAFRAGWAFTRAGVGNVHGIAHTLGGLYGTAHGLANAVVLPFVLEDYGPRAHKKLARLATICGVATAGDEAARAGAFIRHIRQMNADFGHPTGFGFIKNSDMPQMAKWAAKECNPLYPVPVIYNEAHFIRVIKRVKAAAPQEDAENG